MMINNPRIIYEDKNGNPLRIPTPGGFKNEKMKGLDDAGKSMKDFIQRFTTEDPDDTITLLRGTIADLEFRKKCNKAAIKELKDKPDNNRLWELEIAVDVIADMLKWLKQRKKKELSKRKTRTYLGVKRGDWIKCSYCERIMLAPHGTDKCPECGKESGLEWVDESRQEMDVKDLDVYETGIGLLPMDYLTEESIKRMMRNIKTRKS